jgi:hypothetical protein
MMMYPFSHLVLVLAKDIDLLVADMFVPSNIWWIHPQICRGACSCNPFIVLEAFQGNRNRTVAIDHI